MSNRERATALRRFLETRTCFKVLNWGSSSSQPDVTDRDVAPLREAHVASSKEYGNTRHAVVLDIDHPAWLIPSSTPGHSHLYIDVPGGIPNVAYMRLLRSLATCGVIEEGYAKASISRGHSDVRLPWIKKGQPNGT